MRWTYRGGWLFAFIAGCGAPVDADGGTGESSSSGADASSESTGAVELGPNCAEPDPMLAVSANVRFASGSCVVVEPVDGEALSYECEADDGPATAGGFTIDAMPPIAVDVEVGTAIEVETIYASSEWEQFEYISVIVRDAATNELIAARIDALDDDWRSELFPLSLQPIDGACESLPDESRCRSNERRMWNAEHGETVALVGDGTRTQVGDYVVVFQRAVEGSFLECIDVELDFYEALIVRTG